MIEKSNSKRILEKKKAKNKANKKHQTTINGDRKVIP